MDTIPSQILVATPQLPDGNFYRSVVLLIHRDEDGAFGVILNRPSNYQLREVWHSITKQDCELNSAIYMGGPVDGPLVAIHNRSDIAENKILDGVYISSDKDNLRELFSDPKCQCKVISGYSGWGSGQLEAELETGSWFEAPATVDDVFSTSEELWQSIAGRIGSQILFPGSKAAFEKFDPSLN